MVGPGGRMTELAVTYFTTVAFWYYYIEVNWKTTDELAKSPLYMINDYWSRWCRMALCGQPEHEYLIQVMIERVNNDPSLEKRETVSIYKELVKQNEAIAIPALLMRCEAFYTRTCTGLEMYPGENDGVRRAMVQDILNFADSRHADILEKYISEKPILEPLKKRLAEVRARPAPPPVDEPPFRLGKELVIVK